MTARHPLNRRLASVTAARINGQDQPDLANVHRYDAAGHILTTLAEGPATFYTCNINGNLQQTILLCVDNSLPPNRSPRSSNSISLTPYRP